MEILKRKNVNILVVGDSMLDKYIYSSSKRISPEAPVPVLNPYKSEFKLGGAANVANNISALGANVTLLSIIGDDENQLVIKDMTKKEKIDSIFIEQKNSKTTLKVRIMANGQQITRLDYDMNIKIEFVEKLINEFKKIFKNYDLILLSDYNKGSLTYASQIINTASDLNIPVIVDPKGDDFKKYKNADLITPNLSEFNLIVGKTNSLEEEIIKGRHILKKFNIKNLLLTKGKDGMIFISKDNFLNLPSEAKEVFDVTGAGDTVISTFAVSLASDNSYFESTRISNYAASLAVSKLGTSTVSKKELDDAISKFSVNLNFKKYISISEIPRLKRIIKKKKVVFTNGCFDILHPGHLDLLKECRELGEIVIVALNSDISIKKIKGEKRPINNLSQRIEMLNHINYVDYIVSFDELTPENLIREIRPNFLVKGGDYKIDEIIGSEFMDSINGQVVLVQFKDGYSSSNIINKIIKDNA